MSLGLSPFFVKMRRKGFELEDNRWWQTLSNLLRHSLFSLSFLSHPLSLSLSLNLSLSLILSLSLSLSASKLIICSSAASSQRQTQAMFFCQKCLKPISSNATVSKLRPTNLCRWRLRTKLTELKLTRAKVWIDVERKIRLTVAGVEGGSRAWGSPRNVPKWD